MSNHEKLFGICENKCLVETIPKKNFAVIEGELTLEPQQTRYIQKTFAELGFTKNDTLFCVSVMADYGNQYSEGTTWSTRPRYSYYESGKINYTTPYVDIDYAHERVNVALNNVSESQTQTRKVRALIMKI